MGGGVGAKILKSVCSIHKEEKRWDEKRRRADGERMAVLEEEEWINQRDEAALLIRQVTTLVTANQHFLSSFLTGSKHLLLLTDGQQNQLTFLLTCAAIHFSIQTCPRGVGGVYSQKKKKSSNKVNDESELQRCERNERRRNVDVSIAVTFYLNTRMKQKFFLP